MTTYKQYKIKSKKQKQTPYDIDKTSKYSNDQTLQRTMILSDLHMDGFQNSHRILCCTVIDISVENNELLQIFCSNRRFG